MKFIGEVGFWVKDVETKPDIWRPQIFLRRYPGDVIRDTRRFQQMSNTQNENFTVSNRISILADLYAQNNWHSIRYVTWKGVKWKVSSVEVNYPRLILDLGGVYNGKDEVIITRPPEEDPGD